ncbi:hypothetical protein Poly51_49100 [Rubripirellula tenax]|uniref:Uncharacterized protein n=1 Tax=Rubripirellula tenax TaxID=2528015 RepID=A0A5C6EN55_9BACT|nr:hypothetical protein Poly51_49100 [Rubripirellula tenax]
MAFRLRSLQSDNVTHHRVAEDDVILEKRHHRHSGACDGYQTYNAALRGGSGGTFARCRKLPILTQFAPLTGGKWVVFLEIRFCDTRIRYIHRVVSGAKQEVCEQ